MTLKTHKKTLEIFHEILKRLTSEEHKIRSIMSRRSRISGALSNEKIHQNYQINIFSRDKNLLVCIFFGFIQSNTYGTHPSVSCAHTAFYASSVKRTAATSANYPDIHFGMTNPAIFVVIVLEN